MELPVTVTGDPIGSAIVEQLLVAVPVEAEATHIPESVEVDVTGKDVGFTVHARDLALPEGVSLAGDPDALVLHVIEAPATAAPAEEQAEE